MPLALYALTAGAFGIGTTEFVIMGLLTQVAADLQVSIAAAGLLISGYALGVFVGAPLLTIATGRLPRKAVLVGLMVVFTLGNLACALAPDYGWLMAARVATSLAHGTFFGVGAVVGTRRGWEARLIIATLVPNDTATRAPSRVSQEIRAVLQPQVLLGLSMTVLGFAGVFTVYTYIQPILLQVTRLPETAVSAVLLVFGVGMILGNLLGGRLADRRPAGSLVVTLGVLAVVLAAIGLVMRSPVAMVAFTGLLGIAAFATVAPMQLWVLQKAGAAGRTLASSLNIGAFNLGNALGAWLGGMVLVHAGGLANVSWAASLVTLAGAGVALVAIRWARPSRRTPDVEVCPAR